MSEFDHKAADWDNNPMHTERSGAIAGHIRKAIPLSKEMKALEFGAGTGTTSFFLAGDLGTVTMIDNSQEMVRRMQEKIHASGMINLDAFKFDLEHEEMIPGYDLVFTQMVLHHIGDITSLIRKFHKMLNPGGYIAIADLYPEDGSFHGDGFTGHKGIDPSNLGSIMENTGFKYISYHTCYTIEKDIPGRGLQKFDVFLLTARRSDRQ